jgi:hypothetical protein
VSASIIAAQRIKGNRCKKKSDTNNEITTKMFKIEESLLNRFDLIFVMSEPKDDKEYKNELVDMVLNEAMGKMDINEESEWPRERISAHLAFAKTFGSIEFTPEVDAILRKYFVFCTVNPNIPKWRTTARMYEGLRRLTAAHTRLMLRRKTKIFDAATTIFLSELSYPFGHLLEMTCELNDPLPGPDDESVGKILWLLKMPDEYYEIYEKEQSSIEDIENQLVTWINRETQKEPEEASEELSIIDASMDMTVEQPSIATVSFPSTSSAKKPKSTKKKTTAKKTQSSNKTSVTNHFKRKLTPNENQEPKSPKKSRVESNVPLVNDAIISNLSSLARAFEPPMKLPTEVNNDERDKENNLDKELEDELRALEEFDLFGDL